MLRILADAGGDGIDWTTAGPLAAAFIAGGFAFYKEWVVTGKAYARERGEREKAAKQVETLQTVIQDEFLPAFRESTDALKQLTPLLNPEVGSVGAGGGG